MRVNEFLTHPFEPVKAIALPSTSPANLSFSFEKLLQEYKKIKTFL